jgi:hypothetical protein
MTKITRPSLGRQVYQTTIETIAAGTADELPFFLNRFRQSIKVVGISFVTTNAITGDDTNNMTLQIRNKGTAGTGTTAVTDVRTYNVAGGNVAAMDEEALTLSTTAANLIVASNEVLALNKAVNGSGIALQGVLILEYVFDSVAD